MTAASIMDYRERAQRRLPPFLFEYIDGGSYAEVTLRRNIADLERVALRQRVLRDVSSIDLSTELFGQKLALPLALAPIGLAGMNARRGEVQAARAAEGAGVPFILSTVSACPLGVTFTAGAILGSVIGGDAGRDTAGVAGRDASALGVGRRYHGSPARAGQCFTGAERADRDRGFLRLDEE